MNEKSLNDKKEKILLLEDEIKYLEDEIKSLKEKKKILNNLKKEYYYDYFDTGRNEFTLLNNIPANYNKYIRHLLTNYSALNVDTIGEIICKLIKEYNNKDYISKRILECEEHPGFFGYTTKTPKLVIGKYDEVDYIDKVENNIIINYNELCTLDHFPTDNPVIWFGSNRYYKGSNYNYLVGNNDGLSFNYPVDMEYIRELIYSLAYYQKQHDIKQMTPEDTWSVYRKIYKKS